LLTKIVSSPLPASMRLLPEFGLAETGLKSMRSLPAPVKIMLFSPLKALLEEAILTVRIIDVNLHE